MADLSTVARPYAKAAFALANEQSDLTVWSDALTGLAAAVAEPAVADRLDDPSLDKGQWAEAFIASVPGASDKLQNLIKVLAENGRLSALPEIASQFDALRAEAEQTLDVEVVSASELAAEQQASLKEALKQRFDREITINVTQDKSLIGGAIIRAGDQVIDGSVRSKLEQLASNLAR